ncbi:hypothetical protein SteCoe_24051 [Stentor coeruleus]|uniref:Uncharacterized protein n=1 Tax=Stentor coeruleus TaxID=5963 RepID=A0A1R2BIG3_9CILI|nr:hypothetical protein SteCoe_24051 [Stentor coeruleus]
MYHSKNSRHLTAIQTSKTSDFFPNSNHIYNTPPNTTISITRKGEELSLKPNSPYKSPKSITNQNKKSKNTHFPTTPGLYKFIPATEVVYNEKTQNPEDENPTEEVSNDIISNLLYEKQIKQSLIYPTMFSNKCTLLETKSNKTENFLTDSPENHKVSSLYTLSSTNSYKKDQVHNDYWDKKNINKKKVLFYMLTNGKNNGLGKIYCEKCKENMWYSVKIRDIKGNL